MTLCSRLSTLVDPRTEVVALTMQRIQITIKEKNFNSKPNAQILEELFIKIMRQIF